MTWSHAAGIGGSTGIVSAEDPGGGELVTGDGSRDARAWWLPLALPLPLPPTLPLSLPLLLPPPLTLPADPAGGPDPAARTRVAISRAA
jgi:hypothetical protein